MRCADMPAREPIGGRAVLMPDQRVLRLSECAFTGKWQLSHLLTFERCELPSQGEWFLTFDADGQAEIVSEQENLYFAEDFL